MESPSSSEGDKKKLEDDVYYLDPGVSYVFTDDRPDNAYKAFKYHIERGANGLLITRLHPARVEGVYNIWNLPIIWLARIDDTESRNYMELEYTADGTDWIQMVRTINPERLLKIHTTVIEFLKKGGENIVLLDGIEYLVFQNDFRSILKFLHLVNEHIVMNNARFVLPVNPRTLETKELAYLEREFEKLDIRKRREKVGW